MEVRGVSSKDFRFSPKDLLAMRSEASTRSDKQQHRVFMATEPSTPDSGRHNERSVQHVCSLHPRLSIVPIRGAGVGYRASGNIQKGEVLLTENSMCFGTLRSDSDDNAVVTQFLERKQEFDGLYKGRLSLSLLATAQTKTTITGGGISLLQDDKSTRLWIQQCLDNNIYQCRREPDMGALFVALSRFNHSCEPNALNDANRHLAHVRAIRDIDEGEEITISYVSVGNNLASRSAALESFGFSCGCQRCVRERARDPSFSAPCDECGMGFWAMKYIGTQGASEGTMNSDPFSTERVATPCTECGSCFHHITQAADRHSAVIAASNSFVQSLDSTPESERFLQQRRAAEVALLLAPFPVHPDTIQLHRRLVRSLQSRWHSSKSSDSKSALVMEQLREIRRLDKAHAGVKHRDLDFMRCYARLVKLVRDRKGYKWTGDLAHLQTYVETRWRTICQLHFGQCDAPATFFAETSDEAIVAKYMPIGTSGERLALLNEDDEIDLSGHKIRNDGCAVLCANLATISPLRLLDLDSNMLSGKGGVALGAALSAGAAPLLVHLDLMCNNIGEEGARALATAFETPNCSHLSYLDLHGNNIGDAGCVALGVAFSVNAVPQLSYLDLSANGIDDEGCASLSSLFGWNSLLAHLDLSENVIQSCSRVFQVDESDSAQTSPLQHFNVSWNCIADFEPLRAVFTSVCCFTSLVSLRLEGNALSDQEINCFCAKLKKSGATPLLQCLENQPDWSELKDDDESCLRECLQSLADGETINPRVCAEEIWQSSETKNVTVPALSTKQSAYTGRDLQDLLERDGFFVVPELFQHWHGGGNYYAIDSLSSIMDSVCLAGWPPVFCFMCDVVWNLVSNQLWEEMRHLLGGDCLLEPSFFAWSLKPNQSSNSDGQVGQSFGLPHRDYPASEAMYDDGKPKLLNVWIPVNDATLDNGCMYIVPKEFDAKFASSEDHDHMRSATAVPDTNICKVRFALDGARALPAKAGSLLSWSGNSIHWGSSCSQYSVSPPRKSIAMTFRRSSVAQLEGAGAPITQECARAMSLNMRLALISRSLLLYNQWHTLKRNVVPSVIYDVTSV